MGRVAELGSLGHYTRLCQELRDTTSSTAVCATVTDSIRFAPRLFVQRATVLESLFSDRTSFGIIAAFVTDTECIPMVLGSLARDAEASERFGEMFPSNYTTRPNHALQRTAAGRRGCNRCVSWPPSLSLGR